MSEEKLPLKGYKVFNPDFKCKEFQFAENTEYKHDGHIEICSSGFHFCLKASDCFSYYNFNSENIVCEVEAIGEVKTHAEDSKCCTNHIKIGRRLKWDEVLLVANEGMNNTGHSNSGDSNSGNWNSGDRNSGDRNSGDSNSGNWNSGDRNSGNRNSGNWNSGYWNSGNRNSGDSNSGNSNSGYRNSGNRNSGNWNSGDSNSGNRNSGYWNSGDRNSGDSNSGYRNSGAFCLDENPYLVLFDKLTEIKVKDWENMRPCQIMNNLNFTFWIPFNMMSEDEKKSNPKAETTEGYLKTISQKEAWINMWGNLSEENKKEFTSLENFDADKFFQITGIKIG